MHLEAFNIGRTEENYRIREVAEIVAEVVPDGTKLAFADGAGPDKRNYRVDCDKAAEHLPGFAAAPGRCARAPRSSTPCTRPHGLDLDDLAGPRFQRIAPRPGACSTLGGWATDLRWRTTRSEVPTMA